MMEPRVRPMTPREARLVGELTLLRDNLAPVVDQITAGHLTDDEALKLAAMLELVAQDLRPTVVQPDAGDDEKPPAPST